MVNSKAHGSTPSATYSTCSTSTRGSWQIIPRMGRKNVDRWRHRAELVNQGATLVFWCFLSCISWMTARCTMQSSGGLPSNRAGKLRMCAWYASSFPAWKRTYHDLPWLIPTAVYKVVRGWNARTNTSKLWDPHPQCHWEEMVLMLVLNCSCT